MAKKKQKRKEKWNLKNKQSLWNAENYQQSAFKNEKKQKSSEI